MLYQHIDLLPGIAAHFLMQIATADKCTFWTNHSLSYVTLTAARGRRQKGRGLIVLSDLVNPVVFHRVTVYFAGVSLLVDTCIFSM